jgi:hypothetical protein
MADDGGPAFPVSIPGCGDNGWQGMSLRDYFACCAMQAILRGYVDPGLRPLLAGNAYQMADAMLVQRAKTHESQ